MACIVCPHLDSQVYMCVCQTEGPKWKCHLCENSVAKPDAKIAENVCVFVCVCVGWGGWHGNVIQNTNKALREFCYCGKRECS